MSDKVQDYPNLRKKDGSIINNDRESFHNRKKVIERQKQLSRLEQENQEIKSKLNSMEKNIEMLIDLLKEKSK